MAASKRLTNMPINGIIWNISFRNVYVYTEVEHH